MFRKTAKLFCVLILAANAASAAEPPKSPEQSKITVKETTVMVKYIAPIVFTNDMEQIKKFYAGILGLKIQVDAGAYVQFESGNKSTISFMHRSVPEHIAGHAGTVELTGKNFRFELYFIVDNVKATVEKLKEAGAVTVSPLSLRPWGDHAAYFLDPENNLIAVAQPDQQQK